MTRRLCLICCDNFYREIAAAVAAEKWADVDVVAAPARCGRPPLSWDELRPLLSKGCTQVVVFGSACLTALDGPPPDWPPTTKLRMDQCFQLVAGPALVAEALNRGAYLITPLWLDDWRGNLRKMGFDESSGAEFFQDFARELLLLDTGVVAGAPHKLAEFGDAIGLPIDRLAVGLDFVRLSLVRLVAAWRAEEQQLRTQEHNREHARELADHKAAMDFLGRLPLLKNEQETVTAIEEMFHMLFAPQEFHYFCFKDGAAFEDVPASCSKEIPLNLVTQVQQLHSDWAWTESKTGFLLRIARAGKPIAVIAVEQFAFPEYRNRYLNLALSIAGVAGLAIDNARTYQRMKETEASLRKSQHSQTMAQAMAHLGHWEMDVATWEMRWSDETYRILGYEPGKLTPTYDAFMQAIHPDDRPGVAAHVDATGEGGSFDIEFRVLLPGGRERVIHGIAEMVYFGSREKQQLLGAIQDVTERKELQWKLEEEARTDSLTGCTNRRYFLELAARELSRARRHTSGLSLLMLDLDHFKNVNDSYGHPVGDLVLQKLVQICEQTLREEDLVARFGGEEFVVLLPETGSVEALDIAERLRRAIADAEVPLEEVPPLRFTASIGVATLTQGDFDIGAIISRADEALYEAKAAGRNRAVAA